VKESSLLTPYSLLILVFVRSQDSQSLASGMSEGLLSNYTTKAKLENFWQTGVLLAIYPNSGRSLAGLMSLSCVVKGYQSDFS